MANYIFYQNRCKFQGKFLIEPRFLLKTYLFSFRLNCLNFNGIYYIIIIIIINIIIIISILCSVYMFYIYSFGFFFDFYNNRATRYNSIS